MFLSTVGEALGKTKDVVWAGDRGQKQHSWRVNQGRPPKEIVGSELTGCARKLEQMLPQTAVTRTCS